MKVDKKPQARAEDVDTASSQPTPATSGQAQSCASDKVLVLFSRARAMQKTETAPTREEAEEALRQLQQDLPRASACIGQVHEFADRTRIISLLTPLVED